MQHQKTLMSCLLYIVTNDEHCMNYQILNIKENYSEIELCNNKICSDEDP